MTAETFAGGAADLPGRLVALRAQACGMAHERVAPGSGPSSGGEPLRRPSLCPSERRRGNLACTHSLARITLRDALRALADREPSGGFAADLAALDALDAGLCLLDHRRYDAETRMAEARAAGNAAAMTAAAAAIDAAVAAHGEAVAALGALRVRALAGFEAGAAE